MMKYSISSSAFLITIIFLFLILLNSSPALSSRSTIATTPRTAAAIASIEEVKGHIEDTEEGSTELMSLMGWEVCKDRDDEECLRRRVVSEAHLDYIYTQQHKH